MKMPRERSYFLMITVFLFAWFSNCTCGSFLRILLTSGERRQRKGERIREGGEYWGNGGRKKKKCSADWEKRGNKGINNSGRGGRKTEEGVMNDGGEHNEQITLEINISWFGEELWCSHFSAARCTLIKL